MGAGICPPFCPQKMLRDPLRAAHHLKFPFNSPCHFRAKKPHKAGHSWWENSIFWGKEEGVGRGA